MFDLRLGGSLIHTGGHYFSGNLSNLRPSDTRTCVSADTASCSSLLPYLDILTLYPEVLPLPSGNNSALYALSSLTLLPEAQLVRCTSEDVSQVPRASQVAKVHTRCKMNGSAVIVRWSNHIRLWPELLLMNVASGFPKQQNIGIATAVTDHPSLCEFCLSFGHHLEVTMTHSDEVTNGSQKPDPTDVSARVMTPHKKNLFGLYALLCRQRRLLVLCMRECAESCAEKKQTSARCDNFVRIQRRNHADTHVSSWKKR